VDEEFEPTSESIIDGNLFLIEHPLVETHLAILRDRTTPHGEYRQALKAITNCLTYEAVGLFPPPSLQREVRTPSGEKTEVKSIMSENVCLVAINRSGLLMAATVDNMFPKAPFGRFSIRRVVPGMKYDQKNSAFPEQLDAYQCFVFDATVASGRTAAAALQAIKKERGHSLKGVIFICVAISKSGYEALQIEYSEVPIIAASIDEAEYRKEYVNPGIGAAGSRIYESRLFVDEV